jgi:hypothetical protein
MEVTLLDERGMHCEMYKEEEIDDRRLVITWLIPNFKFTSERLCLIGVFEKFVICTLSCTELVSVCRYFMFI